MEKEDKLTTYCSQGNNQSLILCTMLHQKNGSNRVLLHDVFESAGSLKSRVRVIDLPIIEDYFHSLVLMREMRKD